MKNLYAIFKGKLSIINIFLLIVLVSFSGFKTTAQIRVDFTQRTSFYTPDKKIYNIKGDFQMIGNTNLTLVNYGDNTSNNNDMEYVDIDGVGATLNSSSAELIFSVENGAEPECSNIIYAGLYWTGRAHNGGSSPEEFTVDGVTLNKRKVKLRYGTEAYQEVTASPDDIWYPSNADGNMYSAYTEITDYVKTHGLGTYTVADIALREGYGGGTGYYGGWGMIVVYENSKMKWRDVTIFDGHAYVASGAGDYDLPVSGFNTAQNGHVDLKLGLMAGEGDRGISGDRFKILKHDGDENDNADWVELSHNGNSSNNFFNSSVYTGGNTRNPSLLNNTGVDISMFNVNNTNNYIITNNQASTKFKYNSTQDTYIIFCIAMAVDAYVPDGEALNEISSVGGGGTATSALPGEEIEYTVEIRNKGTEAIDDYTLEIPIPYPAEYVSSSAEYYEGLSGSQPVFDTSSGANGTIFWDIGDIPLPADPNTLYAKMTYKIKVTDNCFILSNPNCLPSILLNGTTSGVGATSGTEFSDVPLVQGYVEDGTCQGEPIVDPIEIVIDRDAFVAANCQDQDYTTQHLNFCNIDNSVPIPFEDVVGGFPAGSRFYDNVDTNTGEPVPGATEYTITTGFPSDLGTNVYYAVPPGFNGNCYWEFDITVEDISSIPTVEDINYCVGDTPVALTATPSQNEYELYWYTSETGGTPQNSITPDASTAGTTDYWVAEGKSGQCISPNRVKQTVYVHALPTPSLTNDATNNTICAGETIVFTASGGTNYEFFVNGSSVQNGSTSTYSTGTLQNGDKVKVKVTNANDCEAETAETTITVTPLPDSTISGNDGPICPDVNLTYSAPAGMDAYLWQVSGNASIEGAADAQTVTIKPGINNCNDSFTLSLTTTKTNCSSDSTKTISVGDTEDPSITCPAAINTTTDNGQSYATVSLGTPTTADNCTISSTTNDAPATFPIGETNVIWTVEDLCGNSTTCTQLVTVVDDEDPVLTVSCTDIGDQTVTTDDGVTTYTHSGTAWDVTATDNDGIASIEWALSGATTANGVTTLDGVVFNMGATTVLWTVTDNSGNVVTCDYTVTVNDDEDPVLTVSCTDIGDQTVTTDDGVTTYTHSGTAWDVTATDNDSIASIEWALSGATTATGATTLDGVVFNMGATTVLWTVTDNSGNVVTCDYTVTVNDDEDPVLTVSCTDIGDQTVTTDDGVTTYTHTGTAWDVTATDNDGIASIEWALSGATTATGATTLDGVVFNKGTTTVLWTVTDNSGNVVTCDYTVTVNDDEDPVLTVSCTDIGDQTVTTDDGVTTYTHSGTAWDVTATDNDGIASIEWTLSGATTATGATTLDGVVFNKGTTTVLWTVTDNSGNVVTCDYTVTVNDDEDPVLTVSCTDIGDQTVTTDDGVTTYTHTGTAWDVTATDNDGIASIEWALSGATTANGATTLDGVVFNMGATTVLWTVTDNAGNTVTCDYTVTVNDDEDPILTVSCSDIGDQTVTTDDGVTTYTHSGTAWDVTATDNDGIASIEWALSGATTATGATTLDGVVFNMGATTVLWTVTDNAGNTVTCDYTVTVNDDEDPELTVSCTDIGDQTVTTDDGVTTYTHNGTAWDVTATDNDGIASIEWALSGATTATGATTLDGVVFNMGATTVLWTVTDNSGNVVTCDYTVTVTDDEDPVLTVSCTDIGDQTVTTDDGVTTYTHSGTAWDVTATDNDGIASIEWALSGATTANGETTLDGVVFNMGATTVLWTVTDNAGNTVTCDYTVTVNDDEDPILTVSCTDIGDQTVTTDDGVTTYTHSGTAWDVTATDNDGIASIEWALSGATTSTGATTLDGVVFNKGTTTVLWTVTDNAGNTVTCDYIVTVNDDEDPVLTVSCTDIGDQTVTTDDGVTTYTHSGTAWDVTATDNDGIASIEWALSGATTANGETTLDGVVFNMGATTTLWTVTDNSGNVVTCEYTVTVNDDEDPVLTVSCTDIGDQTVTTDDGVTTYTHSGTAWDVTATDNDGIASIEWSLSGATTANGATTLDGVVFNKGTTTVLWTVTDNSGNVVTCEYTVTVNDDEDPELTVSCTDIGDQTVTTDDGVTTYTHSGTAWDVTATDNDGIASIEWALSGATTATGATTLDGVVFNMGATTVLWTVTDNAGNTVTCDYTVTVNDDEDPVLTVSCTDIGDQTVTTDDGVTTYTHSGTAWDVTATDNDGIASIEWALSGATTANGATTLDGVIFNMGATTVLWTVTDNAGNTVTCDYTVTVNDDEDPVLTVSCTDIGDQTVTTDDGVTTYTHSGTAWDVTATDNDGIASIEWALSGATTATGATTLDGVVFNMGATTVLWTVTDNSGNVVTCDYTVTVTDDEDPVLTVSCTDIGDQTVTTDDGVTTYTHSGTAWDVTATDNDGIASIEWALSGVTTATGVTTLDGVVFNMGATTVLWTVTDNSGNVVTCDYTVTVNDDEDPVLTVSCTDIGDQTVATDDGVTTYTHSGTAWDVTATDNDGIASIEWALSGATTATGTTTLDGVVFNKGTTTVLWTVTDNAGNTVTCDYTVTVTDDEDPVLTVSCTDIGDQTVTTDDGVTTYTHSGTAWDVTATDNDGIASIEWALSGATTATGATTLDGVVFNMGATTVLWTVTDNAGNTVTCDYTVTVNDDEDPVLTVSCTDIGDQTVTTDDGVTTYTHSGTAWDVTATDNDGIASIEWTLSGTTTATGTTTLDSVVFNMGATTVLWTVTDNAGNTVTCDYTVTVNDDEDPVLTVSCTDIGDQTVTTDDGVTTYTHSGTAWDVTSTDNDGIASIEWALSGATTSTGATTLDGVVFNKGTTTVLWTVTDNSGNVVTCEYTVTVNDDEDPVLTVSCTDIGDQTVTTDDGVTTYTHSGTAWDVTATDNDGIASIEWALSGATTANGATTLDGVVFNKGTTTVLWTVTDNSGNVVTCEYTVTVTDDEDPVLTVSCTDIGDQTVTTDDGVTTYTHTGTAWDVTATDNDGIASIEWALSGATTANGVTTLDGVVFNMGATTVLWTVTDNSGNVVTCEYTVTVTDDEDPVLTVSCTDIGDQTVTTDDGVTTYTHSGTAWDVTATDNDVIASIEWTLSGATTSTGAMTLDGVVFNMGATTVLWTVTDNSGNVVTCEYTVTVNDDEVPVFIDDTVTDLNQDCYDESEIQDWLDSVEATDNSGDTVTITNDYTAPTGSCVNGTYVVTFTATDMSGNSSTVTANLVINDDIPPVISGTLIDLNLDGCTTDDAPAAATTVDELLAIGGLTDISDTCSSELTVSYNDENVGTCPVEIIRTYTVTDACNNSSNVSQTITITQTDFNLPDNMSSTVTCIDAVVEPQLADVYDACNNLLTPSDPVIIDNYDGCEGKVEYVYTYEDCIGNSHNWTYTYYIDYEGELSAPANQTENINDPADAVDPGAPDEIVEDACGRPVDAVLVGMETDMEDGDCEGHIVWTYSYTSCDNEYVAYWTYTYNVNLHPESPTTDSDFQEFCETVYPTISDVDVTAGSDDYGTFELHFYGSQDDFNQGNELPLDTPLTNGMTLYISQSNSFGCESVDPLEIQIGINPAPDNVTGDTEQYFCSTDSATIADLVVTGYNVTWFSDPDAQNELQSTDTLVDETTYYAFANDEGCLSAEALAVTVHIVQSPGMPDGDTAQTFCASDYPSIGDLDVQTNVDNAYIVWTDANDNVLDESTALENNTVYYATQVLDENVYCEGTDQLAITVTLIEVPLVTGDTDQQFCFGDYATLNDVVIDIPSGVQINWYDAPQDGNVLSLDTLLEDGVTYYAESYNDDLCTSLTRFELTISIDFDCDNDGVYDEEEVDGDTDGDGINDYLDPDDDNDGIPTIEEDNNGNGNWFDDDCDEDGIVDYLDPDSCDLVPNAFSPGSDGINDTWVIPLLKPYPNFSLEVYNRWGNLIYDYHNEGKLQPVWWDGRSNGRLNYSDDILPTGTYYYIISFNDGNREPMVGWIYLVNNK